MSEFHYIAMDRDRQRVTGTLSAPSKAAALRILSENYPVITELHSLRPGWRQRLGLEGRATHAELVAFTQTLATLLQAGLTLKASLELLSREMQGPMNPVIRQLSQDLGDGEMINQAMARHPQVFNKLYRSLVLAGETGGKLPEVLARLGDFLSRTEAMRDKLRAAAVYPTLVLGFALVVLTLVLIYVIPQLESLYAGLSSRLPVATQMLLNISRFVGAHLVPLLAIVLVLLIALHLFSRSETGARFFDEMKLGVGPTKDLFAYLYTARFSHTLGTLYAAGVPLIQTLDILADTLGNRVLEKRMHSIVQEVKDGSPLSAALHKHHVVTELAAGLVEAGEESGQLEVILERLANYYQGKFDIALQTLAAMAEPALIMAVGLLVGVAVIVLGLPFANLVNVLS